MGEAALALRKYSPDCGVGDPFKKTRIVDEVVKRREGLIAKCSQSGMGSGESTQVHTDVSGWFVCGYNFAK